MFRIVIVILMYHHHKPIDLVYIYYYVLKWLHINIITFINPALLIFLPKNVKIFYAKHHATKMYMAENISFHASINLE
jgi:hypothetical protein